MRTNQCATCQHFQCFGCAMGLCKRLSPTIDKDGYGIWPLVSPDNSCGEYAVEEPLLDYATDTHMLTPELQQQLRECIKTQLTGEIDA